MKNDSTQTSFNLWATSKGNNSIAEGPFLSREKPLATNHSQRHHNSMKLSFCLFFPFIAILILSSCVQTSIPDQPLSATVLLHNLEIDSDGKARVNSEGKPLFSGNAVETFEQTPTKSVSSWKQGKRHGISTTFFYNGNIRQTTTFVNGLKQGPSKEYRISGELMVEEAYLQDNLHGKKIEFLPNGNKIMELNFDKGKLHGIATEWFPNGNQKSSTLYSNGVRSGKASEWYETGQKKLEQTFKNDLQNGERTIWYENGNERLVATVQNGVLEGKANGWFANGQQQFDYYFVNNLEHGDCSEWNNEGKIISKIKFSNGIPVKDLLTGQPYSSGVIDPALPDSKTDKASSQEIKDVEIDFSPKREDIDISKENLPSKIPQNSDIQSVSTSKSLKKPTEEKAETAKLPYESEQDKAVNEKNVETKLLDSTKPSDFDPFAKKGSPENKVSKEATTSIPQLVVPPPPAPETNPFENDPSDFDPFAEKSSPKNKDSEEATTSTPQVPGEAAPSIPPLNVPPPAPTFNPFEDNPLPQSSDSTPQVPGEAASIIPPLDVPPPPASTFNPFDDNPLPQSSDRTPQVPGEAAPSIPPLDVPPPPPAPTFNPFEDNPLPQSSDSTPQVPGEAAPSIPPLDVPPPPPAPTFNPFENDPMPSTDQKPSNGTPEQNSNPFESVNSENNHSSVPLENIFNSPPEPATDDNFNPFDLPADN